MSDEKNYLVPATDIVEMENGVYIFMDLPGVGKQDLTIDLEDNEVVIVGENRYQPVADSRMLHSEFGTLGFRRAFTLSDMVEHDKITAELKNGVLHLFLPKAEALKPRRIPITGM